jgi:hypothetical protein
MTARDASAAWQRLAIWGSVLRVISWPVVVRGAGAAAGGAFERCSNAHAQQLKNMMQPAEIQLISQLINQTGASSYFEWGTGGSTDSFPRALPRGGRAVAVENFPAWCSRVRAAPFASCAIAAGALEYRCLAPENETVGGAGYPAAWLRNHSDAASTRAFGSYIDAIGKDAPPGGWDAVLVDGRFRVACLLEALKFTTPNATIFLHDASRFVALDSARLEAKYAQLRAPADHEELVRLHRTHFTIEKYYEVAARAGNLVQLRRRSGAPGAADAADVTTYRRDPHRRRA